MINFYAPLNHLGYGIHTFNLLKSLDKLGIEITVFPPNNMYELEDPLAEKWCNNQDKFDKDDIGIMLYHESYMNKFYGKIRIGFPVFETGVRKLDIKFLKTLDYILQTSEWGKKYLNSLGFDNVFVVPEGFDPEVFDNKKYILFKKQDLLEKNGIVFCHIGKLETRKSSIDILKVFTYALDGADHKCALVAHMFNPFLPDWLDILHKELSDLKYIVETNSNTTIVYKRSNLKVVILKGPIKGIANVYEQCHFGLYASKAEGWNLPLIESIASGLPSVTTNWTAQSEYLKGYPEKLIIAKGNEVIANDNKWFLGDKGNWIEPDLSSMKQILRDIASNPQSYLGLSESCYNCVKNFTWDNAALKFTEFLKQIGV